VGCGRQWRQLHGHQFCKQTMAG